MDDFGSSYDTPLKCDYNNSFLLWSITAKDHTPRSALQASCKIRGVDEAFREYFLGSSCAGEQMFVEKNLIQLPTAEVNKIFSLNDEHMIIATCASACANRSVMRLSADFFARAT